MAEDVWLTQIHILIKRDGAHANGPVATYKEVYGAPAPSYLAPETGYGANPATNEEPYHGIYLH